MCHSIRVLNCRNVCIWLRCSDVLDVQVSRDEEELAKKRLEVKRGLPLQVNLLGLGTACAAIKCDKVSTVRHVFRI